MDVYIYFVISTLIPMVLFDHIDILGDFLQKKIHLYVCEQVPLNV